MSGVLFCFVSILVLFPDQIHRHCRKNGSNACCHNFRFLFHDADVEQRACEHDCGTDGREKKNVDLTTHRRGMRRRMKEGIEREEKGKEQWKWNQQYDTNEWIETIREEGGSCCCCCRQLCAALVQMRHDRWSRNDDRGLLVASFALALMFMFLFFFLLLSLLSIHAGVAAAPPLDRGRHRRGGTEHRCAQCDARELLTETTAAEGERKGKKEEIHTATQETTVEKEEKQGTKQGRGEKPCAA